MPRTSRHLRVLLGLALLASALAVPVGAAGRSRATPSGLSCLLGRWSSLGFRNRTISGLGGTIVTFRHTSGRSYDTAEADYEHASPMRVTIPHSPAKGKVVVTGLAYARVSYAGHGAYAFTPGFSSEEITLELGSEHIGPVRVKHEADFAHLTCSRGGLRTEDTVAIPGRGDLTAPMDFRRVR